MRLIDICYSITGQPGILSGGRSVRVPFFCVPSPETDNKPIFLNVNLGISSHYAIDANPHQICSRITPWTSNANLFLIAGTTEKAATHTLQSLLRTTTPF